MLATPDEKQGGARIDRDAHGSDDHDRAARRRRWVGQSTSQIALTAHLVMPAGHPDDAFLQQATQGLHDRFEIKHVTLQVTRALLGQPCEGAVVSPTPLNP